MKKLPYFLAFFAIGSGICAAADNDAYVCRLQSLTREFPMEPEEESVPRWLRSASLSVEIQVVPPSEKMTVLAISANDVSITDAKGNALEGSPDKIFAQSGDVIEFNVNTVPQGEWVEIKGNLTVKSGCGIVSHPGQTVKMGEKGKLDIPGCDISYEWDVNGNLRISMRNGDANMLDDFIFKTPSGEEVEIISICRASGEGEVCCFFGFEKDVKTVSVMAKTYSELKSDTVSFHKRIGFCGELNAE